MHRKITTFDITLLAVPLILLAVGIAVIYSLVMGTSDNGLALKQGIIAIIGLASMLVVSFIDYRTFRGISIILYVVSIILLLIVDFFGKTVNGAMNWIDLGFFQLQPSEVAKVFLIFVLGAFFSNKIGKLRFRDIFFSLLILGPPLALILKEPDFGTAMVVAFIYFILLLFSKPSFKQLVIIFSVIFSFMAFGILAYKDIQPFGKVIHQYQRDRISVFLDPTPSEDALLGSAYNVNQAQITIGSGGLLGKGLGKGSQSRLQFLPEAQTDFIFAGIAESFGFLGSFVLITVYGLFIVRLLDIAALARDNFGMLVVFGIGAMFFFQVIVNIGMTLGLMPVTGIPLPLLSSGGTSLLISLISVGVAQSVFIRHKKINF